MSLYKTEEITKLKRMINADLFEQTSINLAFIIAETDKTHDITAPLLTKKDLVVVLVKIYLYFLHPVKQNRYQNYAYDFFDSRLCQIKELNPLKNVYAYGVDVLSTFLTYVEDLELFFRNMYEFYMDYLAEIKYLKRIDFNEKVIFKALITDFLYPDHH